MGLLKDLVGSAMGAGQVNNGFNQPLVPNFSSRRNNNTSQSAQYPSSRPSYQSYSNSRDDQGCLPPDRSDFREACYSQPRGLHYQQASHDAWTDSPPPYDMQTNIPNRYEQSMLSSQFDGSARRSYDERYTQGYHEDCEYTSYNRDTLQQSPSRQSQGFRPFAVPQIAGGDGQPFLRGYSSELRQYGIEEGQFLQIVDSINKAIVPNPENVIFQKAANIAGWFVPGAGGIALMAGQIGIGAGAALGHASLVAKTLSTANLDVFIPAGLEICIGKSDNVDQEAGVYGRQTSSQQCGPDPEQRVATYGSRLAPLSSTYPPLADTGRSDPIAMVAQGMSKRSAAKKADGAAKNRAEGKRLKKKDDPDADLQWLIVRRASPQSVQQWQQTLRQSEASLDEERRQAASQSGSRRY